MTQHACFSFNTANTPTYNADTVNHCRVGVCTNQCVWVVNVILFRVFDFVNAACQIFQVNLVNDTKAWRYNAECVERLHTPFHELITLVIAFEFQFHVQIECFLFTEMIDLNGVINDQVNWDQWLDVFWIFAFFRCNVTHRSQISQQRNASKILQDNARNDEWNFIRTSRRCTPVSQLLDVFLSNLFAVAVTQNGFQNHANGNWQARDFYTQIFFQCWQRKEFTFLCF